MIEGLFERLREMESSRRFDGQPYPPGLEPFPRRLVGQGFFPGGDGLWREDDPAKMRAPGTCPFPREGIMFLGNDFGSIFGFSRLKLHENPPTWQNLRKRLHLSKIPGEIGFFTNAYLGLRNDRTALAHPINDGPYDRFCAEFLEFQIKSQCPRLIVVLGDRPNTLLHKVITATKAPVDSITKAQLGPLQTHVLTVTHPYSDIGKSDTDKHREALLLSRAWQGVSS